MRGGWVGTYSAALFRQHAPAPLPARLNLALYQANRESTCSPLARVRDKHVGGATNGSCLGAQHALQRARGTQQRTHARHQLCLRLPLSLRGICRQKKPETLAAFMRVSDH